MKVSKVSIIIICNSIRLEKLQRLLHSIKNSFNYITSSGNSNLVNSGLYYHSIARRDDIKGQISPHLEILLLHESNTLRPPPPLPLKVRYILIPEKQGIPFNRNQGIAQAEGDIIVFIDDDCWVPENWLSNLVGPLSHNKAILAVTGGTKIPPSTFLGDCISALGFPGGGSLGFEKVWKVNQGMTNHLSVGNCALRREVFEKVGYFDETMKSGAEDTEFSYRLEKAGIPICYVPEAFAYHEARASWSSFAYWQLRRGRANYQFKKKVGNIGSFIKLRFWSAGNIVRKNCNWRLPVVLFLLGASFALQQWGYWQERKMERKMERRKGD